jgi:hypothetical protein
VWRGLDSICLPLADIICQMVIFHGNSLLNCCIAGSL